jgi:hypothetical protein
MNQREFYNQYVRPYLRKGDRPYNRQLYNDTKDAVARDGLITEKQAQNWVYPDNGFFLAPSMRRR